MYRWRLTAALVLLGLAVVSPVLLLDWNDDGAPASFWLMGAPFVCGLIGAALALWGRSVGLAVVSAFLGFFSLPAWIFAAYLVEAMTR
ncbi:hypothetical protein I2485_01235 [Nesterenkonia sp. E16_7]|uniref:hypothetical protein n=1 Tax=unclassified Nesterenkonia TaxID=2629769 RepID=UPI001A93864B|nr:MULTISPECIES: hypothetical protein [unclassified Nesterenkonia]MBO0594522.1 hypothetical protein [Nesterenkonia sp. E16_10]MBO0597270.1 hypothetical protein [Nesterenkonia sp. E16_7]